MGASAAAWSIDGRGDALTIDAADAKAAGLPVTAGASGAVRMADLKIYRWSFDKLRQQLEVSLLRSNDGANFRDFAARSRIESETHPLLALRVDYDLTATVSQRGVSAGGLVDAYVARGNFSIGSSGRVLSNPQPGSSAFVRLESQAQLFIESRGLVAVAGDLVSAGSQSRRPVRMGGFQLATDTQLRPDLVMTPLPAFSGSVSVPTTIDLVSAGLGREVTQTTGFYVWRDLLAPRRTAYAVTAGIVRRRFGIVSNDCGPLTATAYVRRGLLPTVTVEASGEWTAKLVSLGARADFTIAKLVKATVEARVSRDGGRGQRNSDPLQTPLAQRMRLYGSADYRWIDGRGTAAVAAGLSLNLGGARHAGLSLRRSGSRNSASARYTKDEVREGDISYRFDDSLDNGTQRVAAGLGWRGRAARLDGEIEEVGGRFAGRFNARGTLMLAGGHALRAQHRQHRLRAGARRHGRRDPGHAREPARGADQPQGPPAGAGYSRADPVEIDVDPDKLPAEALVKATLHTIRAPARTVALVEIDLRGADLTGDGERPLACTPMTITASDPAAEPIPRREARPPQARCAAGGAGRTRAAPELTPPRGLSSSYT